jgi:hypothetical protein
MKGTIAALAGAGALLAAFPQSSQAVVFASTSDPGYNTNAPSGTLTNSGWQYQGNWNAFSGTPIAPTYFITAQHVRGDTNQLFSFDGVLYHPVRYADCPGQDLSIWKVRETFPRYAPLYPTTNEVGRHCITIGRGYKRGNPVIVDGATNGWREGSSDGLRRWGENDVAETEILPDIGNALRMTFDRNAGSNECHLSTGDSGGALFIQDAGVWKLAGINSGVDGYFSTNGLPGSGFMATLLDMGGLYVGSGSSWTYITNTVADIPSAFYSLRISVNLAWIYSVIDFQPGEDLQITGIEPAGDDVRVSVSTSSIGFTGSSTPTTSARTTGQR